MAAIWRWQGERQDVNRSHPWAVKNTFLHVVTDDVRADTLDGLIGSVRRERSEPARLRRPEEPESNVHPCRALDRNDSEASDDELDNVNCSLLPQSSAGSTRQISNMSKDSSIVSGDSDSSPAGQVPTCLSMPSSLCGRPGSDGSAPTDVGSALEDWELAHESVTGRSQVMHAEKQDTPSRCLRSDAVTWDADVVTVMVRQIPRQYTQLMLVNEANRRGYKGLYDFLYLPLDFKKGINVGYCFLNFVAPEFAQAFRLELDGAFLDSHMRMRGQRLRIHPAKVQGYEANYRHFVLTKTGQKQDPHFSPLFFPRGGLQPAAGSALPNSPGWPSQPAGDDGLPPWPRAPELQAGLAPAAVQGWRALPGVLDGQGERGSACHACGLPRGPGHNFCPRCGAVAAGGAAELLQAFRLEHQRLRTELAALEVGQRMDRS